MAKKIAIHRISSTILRRIRNARSLRQAMDATGLEHYTNKKQCMVWLPTADGAQLLAVVEASPDGRMWLVWLQAGTLGLRRAREWQFRSRSKAVEWVARAVISGPKFLR